MLDVFSLPVLVLLLDTTRFLNQVGCVEEHLSPWISRMLGVCALRLLECTHRALVETVSASQIRWVEHIEIAVCLVNVCEVSRVSEMSFEC